LNSFVRIPEPLPAQVSAAIILDRHFYISHFISLNPLILCIVTCSVLLYYNGYYAGLACFRRIFINNRHSAFFLFVRFGQGIMVNLCNSAKSLRMFL
jgi:hypothetical protein